MLVTNVRRVGLTCGWATGVLGEIAEQPAPSEISVADVPTPAAKCCHRSLTKRSSNCREALEFVG